MEQIEDDWMVTGLWLGLKFSALTVLDLMLILKF